MRTKTTEVMKSATDSEKPKKVTQARGPVAFALTVGGLYEGCVESSAGCCPLKNLSIRVGDGGSSFVTSTQRTICGGISASLLLVSRFTL